MTNHLLDLRWYYIDYFSENLPRHAISYIASAFAGDSQAVEGLIFAVPPEFRGEVISALYDCDAPPAALRRGLEHVWSLSHYQLRRAMAPSRLKELFKVAGTRPTELASKVTVWRGGRGTLQSVRRGWSWTTNRKTACWFATSWAGNAHRGAPIVIQATVESRRVVHSDDGRSEAELVIFGSRDAVVDGDFAEWLSTGTAWIEETNDETLRLLESRRNCRPGVPIFDKAAR